MSAPLSIELSAATLTTTPHEGLWVTIELRNHSGETLELPSSEDQSASWTFELHTDGALTRALNGLTHQAMMTRARIDHRPDLAPLAPGDAWRWRVDLGTLHYGLPVGHHELRVVLRADAIATLGHETLASNTIEIEVEPVELDHVRVTVDNPVVARVLVVLGDDRGVVVRHHDLGQPLATWSSTRLELTSNATKHPVFTAHARFFDASSFGSAFELWVISVVDQRVCARLHRHGTPVGERSGLLPPGHQLLPWACHRRDGTLELFCAVVGQPGRLIALDFDHAGSVRPRFEHAMPEGARAPVELRGDRSGYELVFGAEPGAALIVDELDSDGAQLDRRTLAPPGSPLRNLTLQPHRTFVGAWAEGGEDPRAELVYGELSGIIRKRVRFDFAALGAPVHELAATSRSDGVWDVLVSTTDGHLRFGRLSGASYSRALPVAAADLQVIGRGQPRFFPRALASGGGYLGWFSREHGFRFRPLRHGKLLSLEDIAHG